MFKNEKDIKLVSYEELMGIEDCEEVIAVAIRDIRPFNNHPFKVKDDERMQELIRSISTQGILTPVTIRSVNDGKYEMISGHRRMYAATKCGIYMLPAIIKEMNDDEATIAMVDANVQRKELLPSEKAFSLKMKMDALKHQGATSSTEWTNGRTGDVIGKSQGIKKSQVHKYIRLTSLIPELLNLVDAKKLSLSSAVEMSYLDNKLQMYLYDYMRQKGSIKQEYIIKLRQCRDKKMTLEELKEIMENSKTSTTQPKQIVLDERKLNKYFPAHYTQEDIEKILFEFLDVYRIFRKTGEKNGI